MGLEELLFDVGGVKLYVKPELHRYHHIDCDEAVVGLVPVRVEYKDGEKTVTEEGTLRYHIDGYFLHALVDYFKIGPNSKEMLEKYDAGMREVSRVFSIMRGASRQLNKSKLIIENNYYLDSKLKWKNVGNYWSGNLSHKKLKKIADSIE